MRVVFPLPYNSVCHVIVKAEREACDHRRGHGSVLYQLVDACAGQRWRIEEDHWGFCGMLAEDYKKQNPG
jgi:hypothetical protein